MSCCGPWRKAAVLCVLVLLSFATVFQAPLVGEEGFAGSENEGGLGVTPAETPSTADTATLPQFGTPRTRAPSGWSEEILLNSVTYYSTDPEIDVSGDLVCIIWDDKRDAVHASEDEIYTNISLDGGATWIGDQRLTHIDEIDYTGAFKPTVAVEEEHIYVAWMDTRNNVYGTIWMNISHDSGASWTGEFNLSSQDPYISDWPHIDANQSNVVVVWGDDKDHPGSGRSVYLRLSTDNGTTWEPEQRVTSITDIDDGYDDIPTQVIIKDEYIYILFDRGHPSTGRYETMFMKSPDLGQTWTEPQMLSQLDNWNSYSGGLALDNNRVYVVWNNNSAEDEIYLRRSQDGGDSWLPEQRLTDDPGLCGASKIEVSKDGVLHVFWTDGMIPGPGLFHVESEDNGVIWSEPVLISSLAGSYGFDVGIWENTIHLTWDDEKTGHSEVYYKRSPDFFSPEEDISLVSGWNSLAFPCGPPVGYTTRNLADSIENDTDALVLAVCNWTNRQGWQSFVYRNGADGNPLVSEPYGIGNYTLCKNQSYFVLVNVIGPDTTWNPGWVNYTSLTCPGWNLCGGWNAMALPFNSTGTGLLETSTDILALDPHIIAVADWNETTQSWMLDEGTGDPFPLRWGTTGTLAADYNWNGTWVLCDQYSEITQIEID
ncbi:MAG: exo-alpha-sialidase [Thermoplasmata archaeon]|nr:exo-alpha-sialidase [Thermoplasmata archaeon]